MSERHVAVFAGAVCLSFGLLVLAPSHGYAGDESDTPTSTIAAEVKLPDAHAPDGGSTSVAVPVIIPCRWSDVGATQQGVEAFNTVFEAVTDVLSPADVDVVLLTFYERFGVLHRAGNVPGQWWKAQEADCSRATAPGGVVTGDWRWVVSVPPDPAALVPGATRRVTEAVLAPVPAISPAGPGYVQLGMWLAVEDAGPHVARAQLPATGVATVWAQSTATLTATTFTFGNGDTQSCPGAGSPIPVAAMDDVAQGPCGYTFDDFTGETTITITSRWTVSWELSDGRSGVDPNPIELTTVLPYEVREIQTVGVGTRP